MFPECVFFAVEEHFGRDLFPEWQFSSVGERCGGILFPEWQFFSVGEHFGGILFPEWQFPPGGEHFGRDLFQEWQFFSVGEHFGRILFPGGAFQQRDHSRRGSIPAEGLPFVCRYKSVAGNLFFIPAVFFPYRGDELAGVVDPESHVCDR